MTTLSTALLGLRRWWLALTKVGGDIVDIFKPRGWVELRLIHAHGPQKGQVAKVVRGRNIVTSWQSVAGAAPTSGRDLLRRKLVPVGFTGSLNGDDDACIAYVQLGSGGTLETAADTGLASALALTEKALTDVEYDLGNPYVTFIFEYTEIEANYTLAEIIICSARGATGSRDVFARKTFGAVTKTSDFSLQVRYTLRF